MLLYLFPVSCIYYSTIKTPPMLNSWFPLCWCDTLSWFTWYWIRPRLQLIQKASTINTMSHLKSKWVFKRSAYIYRNLIPYSEQRTSSEQTFPPSEVPASGPYDWHDTGSCRGLLSASPCDVERKKRLVPRRSARHQRSIYTAPAGWNCTETAAISSAFKLKRGGCL